MIIDTDEERRSEMMWTNHNRKNRIKWTVEEAKGHVLSQIKISVLS